MSSSAAANGGSTVTFEAAGRKYVGTINAASHVEKIQTWLDTPVLGDTLVETTYSDYKEFGGLLFPGHIARTQGGYPVLDITVSAATLNPPVDIAVPDAVKNFAPPAPQVNVEKLADGVYFLTGAAANTIAEIGRAHV